MLESDSKTVRFDLSNYQELVIDVPRLRLSNIFKHYPSPSPFPSFPFPSSLSFGTFALNSQNYNPLFEKNAGYAPAQLSSFHKGCNRNHYPCSALLLVLFVEVGVFMLVFANEQAERRRSAWGRPHDLNKFRFGLKKHL